MDEPRPTLPPAAPETVAATPATTVKRSPADPATLPAPDPAPGDAFGQYRLVREVGRGGMGVVYEAEDTVLRRRVALKVPRGADPEELARFRREAQTAATLNHPNIAAIYEVGADAGRPYIAMQFVAGRTLAAFPTGDRRLVVRLLRDAARAVHAAHEHGIIHRDLKPQNLMVEDGAAGAEPRVYVMDFGLAQQATVDASVSMTGRVVGTPAYMPPEQARGRNFEVDPRSDVYSLGATLYDMLTGVPPFAGRDLLAVLRQVTDEEPIPPRRRNRGIDRDLEVIVLKCLEKERERRYDSALALAQDLARWLEGEPIRAQPVGLAYRVRKKVQKHRWLALAIAATLLTELTFGAYVLGARRAQAAQKLAWVEEGDVAARAGQLEAALGAYERACALDRADLALAGRRDEVAGRISGRLRAVQVYKDAARDLQLLRLRSYRQDWRLSDGDLREFSRLIDVCRAEIAKSGAAGDGWWVIGRAHHVLGDWVAASEDYAAGLRAEPGHAACRIDRARVLLDRVLCDALAWPQGRERKLAVEGLLQEAVTLLEGPAAAGASDGIERDLALGYRQVVRGQSTQDFSAEMLRKWAGHDFCDEFYLIRALMHPARAVEDATEALRLRPSFPEAYLYRSMVRQRRAMELEGGGDRARARAERECAIADAARVVEINPHWATALVLRGDLRREQGDLAGATADFTRAIELNDRLPAAYAYRAEVRAKAGALAPAVEDYTQTIRLYPGCTMAYFDRGVLRQQQGDLAPAIEDFSAAIRLNPVYVQAMYNRGRAHLAVARAGAEGRGVHLEAAAADLTQALELAGPSWDDRTDAAAELAAVRALLEPPAGGNK